MKKRLVEAFVVGVTLVGFSSAAAAEEAKEYYSSGEIEFVPSSDPIDPVDPENPDPENPVQPIDPTDPNGPDPGTQGPLSIDYASSFDFGKNRISNKDQVYFARAQKYQTGHEDSPNYVQISDNRGTNEGWTLTVEQPEQLTAATSTKNDVLTGAQISLSAPTVTSNSSSDTKPIAADNLALIPGNAVVVTSAKAGTGSGLWLTSWGAVEEMEEPTEDGGMKKANVTKAVSLSIPGATPKDAVKYQTKLLWALTDVPGN
ncbi:WxL domain-containing protein [Enterococcus malodoratus]|uniref:WxL domain-containing protein n=1 Tax=Enterococcus malodoratus TaxID=71451 RepID=UPI002074959A|nr:WxL domain-containing protein [Enterococcus malodoratus]